MRDTTRVLCVRLGAEVRYSEKCAAPSFEPSELVGIPTCAMRDRVVITEGWLDGTYVQRPPHFLCVLCGRRALHSPPDEQSKYRTHCA